MVQFCMICFHCHLFVKAELCRIKHVSIHIDFRVHVDAYGLAATCHKQLFAQRSAQTVSVWVCVSGCVRQWENESFIERDERTRLHPLPARLSLRPA